jgi:hypothetical protein
MQYASEFLEKLGYVTTSVAGVVGNGDRYGKGN